MIPDQNNGSYKIGQIFFDLASLSNKGSSDYSLAQKEVLEFNILFLFDYRIENKKIRTKVRFFSKKKIVLTTIFDFYGTENPY
jgi:hypothetical protein